MNSPNSQADAGEPALPGATGRPLQGEKALHAAQRSENDRGVASSQGEADLHAAQRSEDVRGVPVLQRSENDRGVQKTTAWPLALATICLIVYASLYPFAQWRDQDISPFRFLSAPLPQYWTGFDVAANLLGYAPLGFLLALSALRSRQPSPRPWMENHVRSPGMACPWAATSDPRF